LTRIRDRSSSTTGIQPEERRLAVAADRAGNADGEATPGELKELSRTLEDRPKERFDRKADDRRDHARRLAIDSDSSPVTTLDPSLRAMPEAVRRLALEIDGLWGDADGSVSPAELDRVAGYYLAALPFFTGQAQRLLELAQLLGLGGADAPAIAPSVHALRAQLARVDADAVTAARPFGELFSEAVAAADIPGAPGLLRDALQHSPRWHRLSILEHSAVAVDAVQALAERVGVEWQEAGATMLLHDVGKVLQRHWKRRQKRFVYWDHDRVGARWLKQQRVPEEVLFQVRHHLDIHKMNVDEVIQAASYKPARVARMLLVIMADHVAKGDTDDQLQSMADKRDKVMALAQFAGIDGDALFDEADRLRARWFPPGPSNNDE